MEHEECTECSGEGVIAEFDDNLGTPYCHVCGGAGVVLKEG
mgnify:FL=1